MPQLQAGQAGQAEPDHGKAAQLGALTCTSLNGNLLCLAQKVESLKWFSQEFSQFVRLWASKNKEDAANSGPMAIISATFQKGVKIKKKG